jgi:hypothetical protein
VTVLIDLGEDRGAVDPGVPARPARPRARSRWWFLVAAVFALLAPSAAAAPVDPLPRLYTIPAASNGFMAVAGDTLFVADTRAGRGALTAYDAADGRRRWSVPINVPLELDWQLTLNGDTLLVAGRIYDHTDQSEAFDAATGRRLWGSTRELLMSVPDSRLVLLTDVTRQAVYAVDERTGALRWSDRVGTCAYTWDDAERPRALAIACDDGTRLRYLDLATGATLGTATVPRVPGAARAPMFLYGDPQLAIVGGVVVAAHQGIASPVLAAFHAGDLAPLWSGLLINPGSILYPCGDQLCVGDDQVVRAYDPRTGVLAQTVDRERPAAGPSDIDGELRAGGRRAPAVVVTPWRADGGTLVTAVLDVAIPVTADRRSVDIPAFGGATPTWIVQALPRPGTPGGYALHAVGVLDDVTAGACVAFPAMLACATGTNRVTFWRVPSSG